MKKRLKSRFFVGGQEDFVNKYKTFEKSLDFYDGVWYTFSVVNR